MGVSVLGIDAQDALVGVNEVVFAIAPRAGTMAWNQCMIVALHHAQGAPSSSEAYHHLGSWMLNAPSAQADDGDPDDASSASGFQQQMWRAIQASKQATHAHQSLLCSFCLRCAGTIWSRIDAALMPR